MLNNYISAYTTTQGINTAVANTSNYVVTKFVTLTGAT